MQMPCAFCTFSPLGEICTVFCKKVPQAEWLGAQGVMP